MSLIKNVYVLSVPYTHFEIFCSFPLIKDHGFLGSTKSFPFVVVPEIDVVLRQHGCEQRLQRQSVCAAAWEKHLFCWGQMSHSQHLSHFAFACLGSSTCQVICHVPEEILTVLKVSSLQNLESEPEKNFGWNSVRNIMSVLFWVLSLSFWARNLFRFCLAFITSITLQAFCVLQSLNDFKKLDYELIGIFFSYLHLRQGVL